MRRSVLALLALLVPPVAGCGEAPGERAEAPDPEVDVATRLGAVLDRSMDRIQAAADSVDDRLQPIPLLRPAEESALRSRLNEAHLERARRLGFRPAGEAVLDSLAAVGTLVRLADTTEHWVIRELDHSVPYVVPDTRALLIRLGERFQARLAELGLPAYRFEVSSVLRTAEQQADLRGANSNATAGPSAHEYGTTVDIPYSAFAAPANPIAEPDLGDAEWLGPRVRRVADGMAELVAARRSREIQAILGRVLREMQSEGRVLVTLERLQPVYHITVAEAEAGGP